jgi:hypothetical protein
MKLFAFASILCLTFSTAFAQSGDSNAPATREDIQSYLNVMHAHEMMAQMADSMSKPMHEMIHQQYIKDKDKLPADFEERMNKIMDSMFKEMPWDQMLGAEVPIYQKHFTKGDVNALIAFYSSPTGQKMMRELPEIMSETMQSIMPMIQGQVEGIRVRVEQEFAQALNGREQKTN